MFDSHRRTVVVVGAQWGDEGKGKLVDVLAERADWVVRYQGGANAGHTVHIGDTQVVLHQIPSGFFIRRRCAIGNGVVLPDTLSPRSPLVEDGGISSRCTQRPSHPSCRPQAVRRDRRARIVHRERDRPPYDDKSRAAAYGCSTSGIGRLRSL